MSVHRILAIACAILFAPAAHVHAQVLYTVTNLGLPSGSMVNFNGSFATDINNAGQVTGTALSTFPPGGPGNRAFRYTPGVGMIDLGSLVANGASTARAINSLGQVVGDSSAPGGGRHAFRYSDGTGMVDLGLIAGQATSEAFGINDLGHVVGQSGTQVFRYTDGVGMTDLGMPPGAVGGRGVAINNAGQIAVIGGFLSGDRAYRYTDSTGYVDIGTLGGAIARTTSIGPNGEVLGSSSLAAGNLHGFYFSDATGMVDLGVLPGGTESGASSINVLTQIVGVAGDASGAPRAVLFRIGEGPVDLNDLIDPNSGWFLTSAQGINDAGQIVGSGMIGGVQRAYLLTPVPEPSSVVLLLVGTGCYATLRLRRTNRNHRIAH